MFPIGEHWEEREGEREREREGGREGGEGFVAEL